MRSVIRMSGIAFATLLSACSHLLRKASKPQL